jgi:hypothetical protein
MERNIRIPIDFVKEDQKVTLNIEQEFDNLEILSLKITSADAYDRQCSDFGAIVGRVMLNSGFGVQNAKVSIFIPITEEDKLRTEITELYPFETINDTFPNGVRYNLLPRVRNNKNPSHRAVGNLPDASDFSHYPQYVEIMDKYYKYTTTTNESGDYMIFGVPLGQHDIIMDFDVFDTNSFDLSANDLVEQTSLNQSIEELKTLINSNAVETTINQNKVPNFIYNGNNNYDVEVKTELDEMPNIFHNVKKVTVSPFWGDDDFCDVGITRCDFKINFKYTPTAIFFGYVHASTEGFCVRPDYDYNIDAWRTDNNPEIYFLDDSVGYYTGDLYPLQKMEIVVYRLDDKLNKGSRKRLGVFSGSYYNGIFRISLPMYMDYYTTNEFGDLIETTDSAIGIPTKGYYAFEIYDTDDAFTNRRNVRGGFFNSIIPGIRIPSTLSGDVWLGGWEGTWGGLFEYDLLNRKRKFYTVKTIHAKHSKNNILTKDLDNTVGYFPKFNPDKALAPWNFPITIDSAYNIDEPTIIGSVLIPRVLSQDGGAGSLDRPIKIVNEISIDISDSYNEQVTDCELYFGIGVKRNGGTNSGTVYANLFSADNFIINGNNVFGDIGTWNFGDNSTEVFTASLYAIELGKKTGAKTNGFNVHPAFNQVVSDGYTYGVFINCRQSAGKESVMEIFIHDITDELPDLIKDGVYSSYEKGNLNKVVDDINFFDTNLVDIYVDDENNNTNVINGVIVTNNDANSYNNKYYYFGNWNETNSLYDIEKNYYIK